MSRLIKLLTLVIMMTLATPGTAFAQSAGDSYNEGIALMKKGDYKKAIDSFKASMAINKSAENKKKCNRQIAICRKMIKPETNQTPVPTEKKISLSKERVPFPPTPMEDLAVEIITEPFTKDWIASTAGNGNWLELSKSMDGRSLIVKCKPTDSTVKRQAKVCVIYDEERKNIRKEIDVVQYGKDVILSATPLEISFKLKGGKQLIDIACNSDTVYDGGKNWKIKQTPHWLKAETTETTLVLEAQKMEKNDPDFKSGRVGQVIIMSQDKECVLKIEQKKSLF